MGINTPNFLFDQRGVPIALHFDIDIKEIQDIVYVEGVPDRVPVDLA